jgi:oligoendopeptidase F
MTTRVAADEHKKNKGSDWNLEDIHTPKERETLEKELWARIRKLKRLRNKLEGISPDKFRLILDEKEALQRISSLLSARATLWQSENTCDPLRNSELARISQLLSEAGNEGIFLDHWFMRLDRKSAGKYLRVSGKHKYCLQRLRAHGKHILSEKEEKIINLKDLSAAQALNRIYDSLTNDYAYEINGKPMAYDEAVKLRMGHSRDLRKKSYDAVFKKFSEHEQVIGEIYMSLTRDQTLENSMRGFKHPLEPICLANDLKPEIIEKLLNVVAGKRRIFQEYFKIKADALGIKDMDRYDIYAQPRRKKAEYSFEKSKTTVLETLKDFDAHAYALAKKIFLEKHVHYRLIKGKQRGAFCHPVARNITPYLLLNHTGELDDLYAMMHEVGHGIHNMLAWAENTEETYHAPLPLAETASIFSEMLLTQRLMEKAHENEMKALLIRMIDHQYASITRQAYFVRFELEAQKIINEGATVYDLNKAYHNNLREQFGSMEVPQIFKHEWKNIVHIFQSPYYCHSYAFGNLMVNALFIKYLKNPQKFTPNYLGLLAAGGGHPPVKLLKDTVQADINAKKFWESGFKSIQEGISKLKSLA